MKVLVTGGAGFIASNLVDNLISQEHDVVIIDNLTTGKEENINSKATFYKEDIGNTESLEKIFAEEKPDIVNHHAAQVDLRRSVRDPLYDAQVNIMGSLNLINVSSKHNVKRFIYASTGGAVYGEPRYLPVDENHIIDPQSQYGVSKHTVEHYLFVFDKPMICLILSCGIRTFTVPDKTLMVKPVLLLYLQNRCLMVSNRLFLVMGQRQGTMSMSVIW